MSTKISMNDRPENLRQDPREGKYLTFSLADEEYGISILKVREIIGIMPVRSIPQAPHFVKGVINLRGLVIPVVDLRLKFAMPEIYYTDRTSIIVVDAADGQGAKMRIGIVVDFVSEVMNIKGGDIANTPSLGAGLKTEFILGMAKVGKTVKILLDIDRILEAGNLADLESVF